MSQFKVETEIGFKKKKDPSVYCPLETHLKYKDTNKLRDWKRNAML